MVLDDLQNAARYYNLHPGFRAGFDFLSRPDLRGLDSGRFELQGDRLFALINRDPGSTSVISAPATIPVSANTRLARGCCADGVGDAPAEGPSTHA